MTRKNYHNQPTVNKLDIDRSRTYEVSLLSNQTADRRNLLSSLQKWPIKLLEPPSVSVGISEVFGGGAYSVDRHNLVSGNRFVGAENQCVGLVCALGLSDRRFPLRCP
ncbi:hypothetical protein QJS10_CPA16g00564 [Acorus calamus]|uniref:Uncharacterized protein n=1 Tax=Acorus calamus TaxID=4465 RepID=A0AAV9D1Z8_ACOCL|nr:hypothetical protein QJS10_CPA16g00564 [Acorus calamus]